MARKTEIILTCDLCRLPKKDVAQRRIQLPPFDAKGGRVMTFDICEDCRASVPMKDIEDMMPKKPRATRGVRVVSMADVEAARVKKKRKKAG